MRLLLVEDDAMIGEALRAGLKRDGFVVDWVHDAANAAAVLRTEPFELLLLDLGLPGSDGLTLLRSLREGGVTLPVLIITARDAVSDRVAGLDAGADDYLIKPFDLDELAARIRALLRRKSGRSEPTMEHRAWCSTRPRIASRTTARRSHSPRASSRCCSCCSSARA